jgi:hypothetical protein
MSTPYGSVMSGRVTRNTALVLALVLQWIPKVTSAQCEGFILTDVSTWTQCQGNSVVQMNYVSWSGGTPPYSVDHYPGGPFESSGGDVLWTTAVVTSDGGSLQLTPDAIITDANGCQVAQQGISGIQYWVDPVEQVVVSSSAWDPGTATATVTLVDNPSDPGLQLPSDAGVEYWLSCTSDPANDRVGLAADLWVAGPERYVLSGLAPGDYQFWLRNNGAWGSQVPCEGMAVAFSVVPSAAVVSVSPRVFLGGAWPSGGAAMNDGLRSGGLIPLTAPYAAMGYSYTGSHGPAATTANVLVVTGPNAIVDWVVVELRSATSPATVVASRPALVQRDGDVVAPDGTSPLTFNMGPGNYHLALRHRNHLGVMTAAPVALAGTPTSIDMTLPGTPVFGTNARANVNGVMCLWPGDVNFDAVTRYTGGANDRDPVLLAIGGATPTNVVTGVYSSRDINLDGTIRYTGANNDRDIILQTIGGSVPTAVRVGQVP